jgi:hypothetical protein
MTELCRGSRSPARPDIRSSIDFTNAALKLSSIVAAAPGQLQNQLQWCNWKKQMRGAKQTEILSTECFRWSGRRDSNPRPSAPKEMAIPFVLVCCTTCTSVQVQRFTYALPQPIQVHLNRHRYIFRYSLPNEFPRSRLQNLLYLARTW